jgi:hypothetical protein
VLAWEHSHRLLLAWQITADWRYDLTLETEVEVTFVAEGSGRTPSNWSNGISTAAVTRPE